jgi:predicted nucleic acid-binding protein
MIIISDTSPLVCLQHLNKINILQQLFDKIIIPPAVFKELITFEIVEKDFLEKNTFIKIQEPQNLKLVNELLDVLDIGEAEAIALSIELKPDLLLIDEAQGREIATKYNIPIKGILGVLLLAKENKLIPVIRPLIERLISEINFRINNNLFQQVLIKANE